MQCWHAVLLVRTGGVDAAGARAFVVTRWAERSNAEPGTSSPTSTTPTPPMALPKRSTAASNTYAAPPSDSETSPTTSPEHSLKQEASDPNYTLNYEEPHMVQTHKREVGLTIALPLRCFKIARLTSHDS